MRDQKDVITAIRKRHLADQNALEGMLSEEKKAIFREGVIMGAYFAGYIRAAAAGARIVTPSNL